MKIDENEIRQQATIYKRETSRPLSDYQKAINKSAQEMCIHNPLMLGSRQKLLNAARQEVDVTYRFKKGHSRSKRLMSSSQPPAKRAKLCQDVREKRIEVINETLANLKERLSYKYKRRSAAEAIKNYKLCDEISEEIGTVSKEMNELNQELSELMKKEKKSKRYHRSVLKSPSSREEGSSLSDDFDHSQRCSTPSGSTTSEVSGKRGATPSDDDTIILSGSSDTILISDDFPQTTPSPCHTEIDDSPIMSPPPSQLKNTFL